MDLDEWCENNFLNRHVLDEVFRIWGFLILFMSKTDQVKRNLASLYNRTSIREALAVRLFTYLRLPSSANRISIDRTV